MADDKLDAIKEKLKKLIEKEASCRQIGNIAEAESFATKISQLLMDYELEVEEVMGHKNKDNVGDEFYDTSALTLRNESDWIRRIYQACAPSAFCRVLQAPARMNATATFGEFIIIFGSSVHREILHFMVAQLSNKCRGAARSSFSKYQGTDKRNTYIRSFLKGCALGISMKLTEQKEHERQHTPQAYGIVLNRGLMVNNYIAKWMSDRGYKFKKSTVSSAQMRGSSTDGFSQGVDHGKKTDINAGVGGAQRSTPKQLN